MLELQKDKDSQLKSLKVLIDDTDNSVLCFALYNSFRDVEEAQSNLQNSISNRVVIEGLNNERLNLFESLEKLGTKERLIVFVVFRGHTDAELRSVAGFANLQRERLQDFPHVIVFCLSKTSFPKFIEQAPDFWAWRSGGLLDFQTQGIPVQDSDIDRVSRGFDPVVSESYRSDTIEKQVEDYLAIIKAQEKSKKPDLAYIARTYLSLSDLTEQLGGFEKALEFSQKAVAISREINDKSLKASALNSLGVDLSKLRRREEALEATVKAVEIFQKLAEERSDAFLPDLARSLDNLGNRFNALGRLEEALKATEKAVEICQKLAEERPDTFLIDLARSLNNLGNRFNALGRLEEALKATEKAVEIHQKLVEERPDAFLPDLAISLNNLGNSFSALGRREEALKAIEKAVEIRQKLVKERPDTFLPDLAMSLNSLGMIFSTLGHQEEALKATEKAVEIHQKLVEERPDTFLPDLAMSLNNLGNDFNALGRLEEALKVIEKAVEIRQKLAEERPDTFLPALAMSYGTTGSVLKAGGKNPEAVEFFADGIRALKEPFLTLPMAFKSLMQNLINDYLETTEVSNIIVDDDMLKPILEKLSEQENQLKH